MKRDTQKERTTKSRNSWGAKAVFVLLFFARENASLPRNHAQHDAFGHPTGGAAARVCLCFEDAFTYSFDKSTARLIEVPRRASALLTNPIWMWISTIGRCRNCDVHHVIRNASHQFARLDHLVTLKITSSPIELPMITNSRGWTTWTSPRRCPCAQRPPPATAPPPVHPDVVAGRPRCSCLACSLADCSGPPGV